MSEIINDRKVFSLLEVTKSIEKTISKRYNSSFWVKAEMTKLNYYKHSGHCYPDLVEKRNGKLVAQIRANLWSNDYQRINKRFQDILKEPLKDGINILFNAIINFNSVYGLSLHISDIDPSYTLGELEREKQETINSLKKEGIFENNKKLKLPLLPKRIALISVETSKGYSDFLNIIDKNDWGYRFFHMLFPSLLQGDKAADSIINRLKKIKKVIHYFDVVAIIRGGGGDIGLACYNTYELSREVALFPIPVLTGIGHSTNETVVEMTAHNNITPTKLAEFLIQQFHNFAVPLKEYEKSIIENSGILIDKNNKKLYENIKFFRLVSIRLFDVFKQSLKNTTYNFRQVTFSFISKYREKIIGIKSDLHNHSQHILTQQQSEINNNRNLFLTHLRQFIAQKENDLNGINEKVRLLNPDNVLKRGYSITYYQGKSLKNINLLRKADKIITKLFTGKIESIIESIEK